MSRDDDGILHAGLVARRADGLWRGVLIQGPSGAGKSDLALRVLSDGFRLVADDRVVLWRSGAALFGRAPDPLRGRIEVRGLDVVAAASVAMAEIALVVRSGTPERIPQLQTLEMLGISVPLVELDLRAASAPAKLSRAFTLFDAAHKRRI